MRGGMRIGCAFFLVLALAGPARAGELDLDAGLQAATTSWANDHGGELAGYIGYWFVPWLGASYLGKEGYATVDDRFLSYFSFNLTARAPIGPMRLVGELGIVHQHEESRAAWENQPFMSVVGVADGIRHRYAGRAGVSLRQPLARTDVAEVYAALDLDSTLFADTDKGPRWMWCAGLSMGFTYDLGAKRTK
jgi:hypothetical protein